MNRKNKRRHIKKDKREKIKKSDNFNLFVKAGFVFLFGVLLLVGLNYYELVLVDNIKEASVLVNYSPSQEIVLSDTYVKIIQPIIYNIGVIVIVLAVGTMLMELFGYLQFYRKRIAEVFTDKELVNLLSDDYKKELKTSLLQGIYKPDTTESTELISLFDDRLSNIMDTFYYSEHNTFVECQLLDSQYIKKSITRVLEIKEINSQKSNYFEDLMCISYKELEKGCSYDAFKMQSIEINGKPLEEKKDYDFEITDCKEPYSKIINYRLINPMEIKNTLLVKMTYTTIVPIEDRLYSVKVNRLCKDMKCRVTFNKNDLEVYVTAFKFSTGTNTIFKCEHFESITEANSNGWLLPGEGVAFSLFKKTS